MNSHLQRFIVLDSDSKEKLVFRVGESDNPRYTTSSLGSSDQGIPPKIQGISKLMTRLKLSSCDTFQGVSPL